MQKPLKVYIHAWSPPTYQPLLCPWNGGVLQRLGAYDVCECVQFNGAKLHKSDAFIPQSPTRWIITRIL